MYYTKLTGRKVQKVSEKALALLKDHLELPLMPIQATQMTTGPVWTRLKRLQVFWTPNRNLATWKPSSIEGAQLFTKPLKRLCASLKAEFMKSQKLWMIHFIGAKNPSPMILLLSNHITTPSSYRIPLRHGNVLKKNISVLDIYVYSGVCWLIKPITPNYNTYTWVPFILQTISPRPIIAITSRGRHCWTQSRALNSL